MTFSTANVQEASLYQTVQLDLQSNPLVGDPSITTGDLVFFVAVANTAACVYSATPTNAFTVTASGAGGYTGVLTLPITPAVFTVGTSYYPCYLSAAAQSATVLTRDFVSSGEDDALTVWSTLYTSYAMTPTSANGGEGLVSLTITQAAVTGRAINTGLTGSNTILLVPCSATITASVTSNCANLASLVVACDAAGTLSTRPTSVIALSGLTGQAAGVVTGSFTVPYSPSTAGYFMCVPYCYSTAAGCGTAATAMSYTVVVPSTTPADYTLTFGAADPGTYTRTPTTPQAREAGYVYFSGAGLSAEDEIKVIRSTDECTSTTASLITNLEHGSVEVVSTTETTTSVRVYFVAPDLVTAQVVGRVCYYRAGSGLWSTAYLSAASTVADFTIDVLQPTGFTITNPSTSPTVGETLTISFAGSGLDGSVDLAYLSASTASDPCSAETVASSGSGSSSGSSSSSSNNAVVPSDEVFVCTMSGDATSAPTCTVTVDPTNTNLAMELSICYLKGSTTSQQTNYAQISGTVLLAARNPTYTVTPYPAYAGQSVALVFTGTGLSADDTVRLVSPGSSCSDATAALTTVTLSAVTEVTAGTSYQYTLVGTAETCVMVCYRLVNTANWIVARGGADQATVSSSCAATNIYLATFPVRYAIVNLATATETVTAGTQLTVAETGTLRFTTASGQSFTTATAPTAVKLVQATNTCVTAPCGAAQLAACAETQATTDYASAVTGTGGVFYTSYIQVNTAAVSYIVCVETSGGSGVYVPVLPTSETSATSTAFAFTSAAQNPTLTARTPTTWRASMSTLTSTFTGTGLDAATNVVYAVAATALLSLSTTVAVCPPVTQTPTTTLVSAVVAATSTSTAVQVRYTRADQLYDGAVVYLCYSWSTGSGDAHVTLAGSVSVAAAIPSSMTWVQPTDTTGLRAGHAIAMSFMSNLTSLSATADAVYFYRFASTANPNPNCYCDATACAAGTRVSYAQNTTMTVSTTGSIADDTVTYSAPLGFSNYDFAAVYIMCYAASTQAADTYMGRVTVAMANPTYYTVASVANTVNRVGAPINITAVRRCLTAACESLSLTDSLRLVPSTVECADLTDATTSSTTGEVEADAVQAIGSAVLGTGALSLMRRFVVDVAGTYRVCYRLASETAYSELVFSNAYVRTFITVTTANPTSYTPTPASPSAGQFLTIDLTCATAALCSTCTMVRIVPGARASCWELVEGTYSSDSCLTVTSVQFPDQYLTAGTYTVCYGATYYTSRRIPTWLTVADANPASYTPTAASGTYIYTNQGSNYTLEIAGTGLTTADTVFLLPSTGYSCHDLRTGAIQSDGQLATWLLPSVNPYPLTLTGTEGAGVTWVVSNTEKRFEAGVLYDTTLCPGSGAPCGLQLCYLRSGTSWAPVSYLALTTSSSSSSSGSSSAYNGIELVESNPSSVVFDRYPLVVDMYVMATVQGASLLTTDTVVIHDASCAGTALTVSVTGATFVNTAATEWVGVLRVTGSASSYAVCYWRDSLATEIATIAFDSQADVSTVLILRTPLYYMLSPTNFTTATTPVTQYEQLIVGGSFTAAGTTGTALTYVQLISADTTTTECNYAPFQAVAGTSVTDFDVAVTLESVTASAAAALPLFQGRLNVNPGTYALCMNTTTGLFRTVLTPPSAAGTTGSSTVLTVYDAVPATYASAPSGPMAGQVVTLTFLATSSGASSAVATLAAGDVVSIIDGSLYECGFTNATVLAQGLTTVSPTNAAATTVALPLPRTIERDGATVSIEEQNFTICYQKQQDGSFATAPVTGGTADKNFYVMAQVPTQWTSVPTQAQVAAPITITFYGDSNNADFLTASDVAFLVPVDDGATLDAALCATAYAATSSSSSSSSSSSTTGTRPVIRSGTMTKPGTVNTQWSIAADALELGAYMVCYVATNNGEPVYVSSPETLIVYETQSPTGAYLARSSTAVVDNLNVLQGERVFLLFRTAVALNVTLDNTAASSSSSSSSSSLLDGYDVVRITTDSACATPLTAGVVDAIPDSFGYAALGLVDATTGITIPYLHLRIRADVGSYYVCMRRTGRTSLEAYYNFEVVGGLLVNPAVLVVAQAPVLAFTTAPAQPRVWMPHTNVTAAYGTAFTMADVVQFFFVPFVRNDGGSVTDSDEMAYDSCYRPSTAAEATSADVTLVDTTLQVYLASPMFTRYSFDAAGTHLLCYQTTDRNIASVYPSALTVLEASPISYTVPSVIAIQNDFSMTFVATAAIFTTTFSHEAQLYATDDATIVPNCSTSVAPSGGTTHFTTFTAANTTAASVAPTLLTAGYYYVCFVSYTDTALYFPMYAFPVPNVAGGYVFSVGLTGAQSYTVAPQPAYLGQQLHLTITGNQLSSDDRVKIVRVSQEELSGSDSVASNGDNYASVCTADAVNADAAEANGAAGSAVSSTNAIVADYYPRVNETGTFILCYASALLSDAWVWVSPVHQFTVGAARPTSYALSVTPPYETEVLYLYIYDASSDGGLLQDTDTLKLVDRGASGFDCTAAATQSSAVGLATYDSSVSNSSVHVYRVCGLSVATVTVCYALSASTVGTTVSWAEVPLQSPPETYVFAGVTIEADPFVGPFRGDLGDSSSSSTTTTTSSSNAVANQWVAPRPYEPFTFYFTTTVASLEVQRVAFAQLPVTTCAVDVTYVTPLLSEKQTARASEFEVVLPYAGNYAVFLGPYAAAADPNITHSTALVVGQCDPCSFTPNYALIGGTVSLSFPSSVGGSLSDADEIRLFPISQGLAGRPCEAPEGPYAGVTLTPVAAESTSSTTVFTVSTGTEAEASTYLGEYYVCYRKVSSTTTATARFAVVAENDGTAATFSIYPVDLLTAAVCPASPMFALETAVFNVTASDTTTYPGVAFAAGDQMIVVPTDAFASSSASTADASAGCAAITDVSAFIASTNFRAQQPTLDTYGSGFSNWVLTFASQEAETSYVWCYKMLYDSVFRSIAPASQVVEVENPYAVATTPPVVLPDSTGVVFTITGTDLATTDAVYIVPATESCAETCYRALTPTQWTATAHTVAFVNSTTVTVTFAGSLNTAVTLGVCYRRTGRYLTRLANVVVGDPNPLSYTVDFTPRVGTRPTLTFTGVNLTATDAFMLVQPGATCLLRNAVAVGAFVSVSADATTSAFTVTLTAGVVAAQSYTVCYQVSTVGAYAVVSPVLPVLDGMPTAVVTSNTPMRGRATELSVADPGEGDEMFIACPGCSCYDATTATVPYGNVSATAAVVAASSSSSTASSAAPGVSISIRVGFNDTESYPVCYKRADSGYAQIGGTAYFVTPVANSPSAVAQLPDAAAQYQGQRLHYNFTSYSTAVPLGSGDAVMLVQSSRECWDNLALSSTGIVVASSALTGTVDTTVGQWAAHVPSLGPDVPTDPSTLFPLSYLLCYRESAQAEYVSVPYVMVATTMAAADPASFTTAPAAIETGMVRANATFSYTVAGVEGDEAYMVQFTTLTNTVCDDAASTVVAARASAYPTYTFSLTGTAVAGTGNTAVCYVRSGATVAEVPQLLTVVEGNPSGYVTNITTGQTARERQYIEFTIVGTGLDAATDTVAFTDVPCAEAAEPITSSSYLARLGDATSNGTAYVVEAQFIAAAAVSPISIYVCYQRDSVWREVGAALTLDSPQPTTVTVFPSTGLQDTPRAGQHLYLTLNGGVATIPTGAAVLSARTTGEGTWCHNFTAANVQETSLTIESATLLSVPVWETPGAARLCVLNDATVPWSDVAATVEAASIVVNPANPSSMDVYPSPPRVGQSVTLTFHLLAEATAQDAVKITTVDYTACEDAVGIPGLADAILVTTVVDSATTTVTLVDSTDPLLYRSFNATGSYRVCYYSGTEQSWSVVGGSLAAGTVTVEERVPQSWAIATGAARVGQAFALSLYDELGILQPTAGSDLVWATPSTVNCGQDPYACANCLIFGWSTDGTTPATSSSSVGMVATTTANATVILDSMNLCYRLAGATAALIPGALTITTGPVQCVEQTSFVSGQHQQVTFELEEGTDVTNDAWRLSFYATTAMNCEDRYVDDFVPGMAVLDSSNATAATYSVVWPVGLGVDTDRYTLCYDHNGVVGPICTCGQIAANTGDCFIMASPGSPQNFTPSPQPTYVGQTITLTFAINDAMTAYPPTAIKFVTYTGLLTSCDSAAAFTPTGATLTRVSATVYTYVFKHDYTLGTSTLVVCALTDLSTSYARVASTIVPSSPSTTHTLWIRPYLTLSTFPALTSNYLRVLETVNLTFTMASQEEDDVVSAADSFTFVSDPTNCVESFIESQDAATLMAMFELGDTAFLTLPALVLSADAAAFASRSLATFANTTAGPGTHYLCYKLAAGTYAPVLPALTIGEALFASCSVTGVVSADNEDSSLVSDSGDSTTNNGGPLRAMYYAPTVILGSAVFGTVASAAADAVRVVPAAEWCTNDAAVVFSSTLVATTVTTSLQTVFFASLPGTYKVCYRFGSATTTNWSPACRGLGVRDPTPTAATTGCWNVGQTLAVALTQPVTGHVFSATDRLRFIAGTLPCLQPTLTATSASATVAVNDATQAATGLTLSDVTAGQTTYSLPAVLFRTGTTSVRLCYTDAAGNEFAVPLLYASLPGRSSFTVQSRQPSAMRLAQANPQVGQRLLLNFTSAAATVTPALVPYGTLPAVYTPGAPFDGTFDGATLLALAGGAVYVEGRCAAALRAGTLVSSDFYGVYGAVQAGSATNFVPYTIGNYDPAVAQNYIACYQLATCGVVDSGDPLRVNAQNPSDVYTVMAAPRRGQLINVYFERDTTSATAVALTPGSDRAVKQANLASCWTLADTAGTAVLGTTDLTYFTTIFYAQAPALAANTTTRSCYHLVDGSWSEVPNGVAVVQPANPASFETLPASARVDQVNYIVFHGASLGASDRVKIITQSLNCSEDSVPPTSFAAYTPGSPNTATTATSSAGWAVMEASTDGTTARLNFTATATGTYSVCYRLATDTVWTLVYADLTIYERNPAAVVRTPVATLEGELFTLNFTAATTGTAELTANDRVVLYYGSSVNCAAPTAAETAPSVTAAPSRSDLLPTSIAFQMDAGTRGDYTLCYRIASASMPTGYVTVWGYDVVVVAPNPENVTLYPASTATAAEAPVYRANELLTYVFEGWGLVATASASDSVKLIPASALASSSSDATCQQTASAAAITYYGLYANGTHAVQVWRASAAAVGSQFAVCYKLNGGQYHAIGDLVSISAAASPSGATSAKLAAGTATTTTLSVGESMSWTLAGTTTTTCAADNALLFYSANNCHDVDYYVDVAAALAARDVSAASAAAFDALFPAGVAVVTDCSAATLVRVPSTYTLPSTSGTAAAAAVTLSLCYWSAGNNAVSVLSDSTITLTAGEPAVLDTTLAVTAQEVFTADLTVAPTADDWVVFVTSPDACVGTTAPTDAAYVTEPTYDATTGVLTVTAVVPDAGTYYMCYAHRSGTCAASTGRECARVVATLAATASGPRSWVGQPSPLYVSSAVAVTLSFTSATEAAAAGQGTTAAAWLAPMVPSAGAATLTMRDAWAACVRTNPAVATASTVRHVLTYGSASGTWTTAGVFTAYGSYALCYTADSTAALHIFGPLARAGPTVLPSTVATVSLPSTVTVSNANTIVLTGGGMSTTDVVEAVAVPAATSSSSSSGPPADMCTNTAYTPRVTATNSAPAATASTGLSTMLSNLVFTSTGSYVLCYTATYGSTVAEEEASTSGNATPVLLTDAAFAVVSSVVSMTVLSPVLQVNVLLEVQFTGTGLSTADTAALVYVPDALTVTPTVAAVCQGSGATYTAMQSAAADGTTAVYAATPTQEGIHMVCFRAAAAGATPVLMPTQLSVGVQTAASVVFTVQPSGCTAMAVCSVQPTVTLLDASSVATAAPFSTVAMTLYLSDATTAAPAGYLGSGDAYQQVDYTNFTFYALRVSTAGTYYMRATVTLPSGGTLTVLSNAVTVADAGSGVSAIASVTCVPSNLLDRTVAAASTAIDCVVADLTNYLPDSFSVVANAGTVSAVTRNGTTSGGLPTFQFTVTAPETSATTLVNYVSIAVTPSAPYESWPVENSPVTVCLTTAPTALTTLTCSAGTTSSISSSSSSSGSLTALPLSNMIRVGDSLTCGVQGKATMGGVAVDVVAPVSTMAVSDYYNADVSSGAGVALGAYPSTVNGLYTFTLTPSSALNVSVAATVQVASTTVGGSATWSAMVNSPLTFILIGTPTAAASRLACASARTGSALWYVPAEPLTCTATLANAQGSVNGLQGDYTVVLPDGGSVAAVTDTNWGPALTWRLTAAPQPTASSIRRHDGDGGGVMAEGEAREAVDTLAAVTESFAVQVRHTAAMTTIGAYTGGLVYVTRVVTPLPNLTPGRAVTLTLVGVGLVATHRYALGTTTTCATVQSEATAALGGTDGQLVLSFVVPSVAFTICFAPADATTVLQALVATPYTPSSNNNGGQTGKWAGDDLVLLIIGVIFLFILLLLLFLLLWCILCVDDDDDDSKDKKNVTEEHRVTRHIINNTTTTQRTRNGTGHVYMPPRANTRYVMSAGSASSTPPAQPAPLPIAASMPQAPQQQQQQTPPPVSQPTADNPMSNSTRTHVRVNIHDTDGASSPAPATNTSTPPPAPAQAAAAPPAVSSGAYTAVDSSSGGRQPPAPPAATQDGGGKRRHRHRGHRSSSSGSGSNSVLSRDPNRTPPPLLNPMQPTSAGRYADLDRAPVTAPLSDSSSLTHSTVTASRRSLPPLPPPAGLVKSPQQQQQQPPPIVTESGGGAVFPPLPPPPASPAVTATASLARDTAPQPQQYSGSTSSGEADGEGEMVGPFRVTGHTSTPMVRSPASSRRS